MTTATPTEGAVRLGESPVLDVHGLTVTFRTEVGSVSAVDHVDLRVAPGEIVGIVGESGCGKSVTAMSLAGLLPRSARVEGSVRLEDVELVGARPSALRRVRGRDIAYIFQEPMSSLNPVLTVGRQVVEVLQAHERLSRKQALEQAVELLTLVGIPAPRQRVEHYPHQLSGGMRQRVMIAMALACRPEAADRRRADHRPRRHRPGRHPRRPARAARPLRHEHPLITHDLGVIADIADRVMVMYAGRVVESAGVHELFASPQHHYTAGLLAASPRPGHHAGTHRLQEIPGLVPVLAAQPDACTFADRCPAATDRCASSAPPFATLGRSGTSSRRPGATPSEDGVEHAVEHGVEQGVEHRVACWHPCGAANDHTLEERR